MPPIAPNSLKMDDEEYHERFHLSLECSLVDRAAAELEQIRYESCGGKDAHFHSFPPACLSLLKNLGGNHRCVDCGDHDPQWAAVSYGALLCLQCSGRHRSLGVQVSCVRSISMDDWSQEETLAMLEGGNAQLHEFFARHNLCADSSELDDNENKSINRKNVTEMRYKTKAALFYRQQMEMHVKQVAKSGAYRGREVSRRIRHRTLQERNSFMM